VVQEAVHQQASGGGGVAARWPQVLELVATLVLSAATVLTAWSAFESSKWSGLQATNFSRASATRTESLRYSTMAGQQEIVDSSTFTAWLQATEQGQTHLAALLARHFSPELRVAFDQWKSSPHPPPTPFELGSYRPAGAAEAATLEQRASEQFHEATVDNQRSDNYVMLTVLTSVALFFGAVSSRFTRAQVQSPLVATAVVMFVVSLVLISTFPVKL
jgi:hypothetical protein